MKMIIVDAYNVEHLDRLEHHCVPDLDGDYVLLLRSELTKLLKAINDLGNKDLLKIIR